MAVNGRANPGAQFGARYVIVATRSTFADDSRTYFDSVCPTNRVAQAQNEHVQRQARIAHDLYNQRIALSEHRVSREYDRPPTEEEEDEFVNADWPQAPA